MKNAAVVFGRVAVVVVATVGAALLSRQFGSAPQEETFDRIALREGATLTIALTGDVVMAPSASGSGRGFDEVAALLNSASLAVTNLDQNLLEEMRPGNGWPSAPSSAARELRRLGIGIVSCANNHGFDYGIEGLRDTRRLLQQAGLISVGCGENLQEARAFAFIGAAPARVAVMAVTVSAAADARATNDRGEIKGRPGVSTVRYSPSVTADPATFAALEEVAAMRGERAAAGDELHLLGTLVHKGPRTVVTMLADESDVRDVLDTVEAADRSADAVIVTLHNHEPSNHSAQPADFVQALARQLIDAGANLVVGHGPHQLRGVETYNGGAILYSLGDFIFHHTAIDFGAADVYEAGHDLYQLALGAGDGSSPGARLRHIDESVWWEGAIALAAFDPQGLASVRLVSIDLGVEAAPESRGTPRLAGTDRAQRILSRLAMLSADLGTTVRIDNGIGVIDPRLPPLGAPRP